MCQLYLCYGLLVLIVDIRNIGYADFTENGLGIYASSHSNMYYILQ